MHCKDVDTFTVMEEPKLTIKFNPKTKKQDLAMSISEKGNHDGRLITIENSSLDDTP